MVGGGQQSVSTRGVGIKGPRLRAEQDRTGQDGTGQDRRPGQSPQRQAIISGKPCRSGRGRLHYPVKFN